MKILGISSSPRPNSNSKYALEQAIDFLKENNVECEIIDIDKLDIKCCRGCDYCKSHEAKCVIPDDMQEIYEKLKTCDGFILTSPIYMAQLSAQAKIFMDRLYAYFMSNWTDKYGSKKVAMLITQGQPGKELYKANIENYKFNFEEIVKFDVIGYEVLTENNQAGIIKDKPEQIEEAVSLAKLFLE